MDYSSQVGFLNFDEEYPKNNYIKNAMVYVYGGTDDTLHWRGKTLK